MMLLSTQHQPQEATDGQSLHRIGSRQGRPVAIQALCHKLKHPWRNGPLDPVHTVALFIQQIAAGNVPLSEVRHFSDRSFTPSAYCQARQRLPLNLLQELCGQVHQAIDRTAGEQEPYRWHGHRAFFVDGSSFSMPDTPQLQKHFGQPKGQRPGCGFPIGHLLALFNATGGTLSEPVVSPLYTSDLKHLPLIHPRLAAGDVLTGDDLFSTWAHFALLLRGGLHAVMPSHAFRIVSFRPHRRYAMPHRHQPGDRGRPRSRWIRSLGYKDQLVEWFKPPACPPWISPQEYEQLPKSIVVRETQRQVRRRGRTPLMVTVLSTLLDARRYPARELIALRMQRWDVEVNLRHLKTTMGMEVLHCQSVAGVQKEVAVFALVYNLVRAVMMQAARRQRVAVGRISFADTLQWLRHAQPDEPLPDLLIVPWRPGRVEPRAVKRRPKEYPRLTRPREQLRQELLNPSKHRQKAT